MTENRHITLRTKIIFAIIVLVFQLAGTTNPRSKESWHALHFNDFAALQAAMTAAQMPPASLQFSGANYVEVPNASTLNIATNLTLEAWIRPTSAGAFGMVVGKGEYEIGTESLGAGYAVRFNLTTSNGAKTLVSSMQAFGGWTHIAGSYDGSNMRLFVNGSRVATLQTSGNISNSTTPLRIGSKTASDGFFNGRIDEVRVSKTVRYSNFFVLPTSAFVTDSNTSGLWHFDEPTGVVVEDASSSASNGVLVNAPDRVQDSPFGVPDVVPPVLSSVSASNLRTTRATISWVTDEYATSKVEYGITTALGSSTQTDAALVFTHTQLLDGLIPNTTYYFRVTSRDTAANTTTSNISSFATPATNPQLPPEISGVSVSNITQNGAQISWVTDMAATRQVEYGQNTLYSSQIQGSSQPLVVHSIALSGLLPGTTYHFRVSNVGENGLNAQSGDNVFQTSGTSTAANKGEWSARLDWPLVAVHSALLPDGQVLTWDAWETVRTTSARIWNPGSQQFSGVTNQFSAIFCAGQSQLGDGRLLVVGGFVSAGTGIRDADIFNWQTKSWTSVPNMHYERWYPTTVGLGDGRVLVLGGDMAPGETAEIPEVYDASTNMWTALGSNTRLNLGEYPPAWLLPDGKVFVVGPDGKSYKLDVNAQQVTNLNTTSPVYAGTGVMYRPGKAMLVGGAGYINNTTALIDLNAPSPVWRYTNNTNQLRFQHNMVVLPDGKVLLVGGASEYSLIATDGPRTAELFDPISETWSEVAAMQDRRMYHSTALLLPDGRVLVAGGGRVSPTHDYQTAEIYSPPYLFKGARPTIVAVPNVLAYGTNFNVQTPEANGIDSVALVRLSSTTHGFDMDQRYVPLTFNATDNNALNVQMASNNNVAPPGYYMLFIVDATGVPSAAKIVLVGGAAQQDAQSPVVVLTAPTMNKMISGSISLKANATDNESVAGVQFYVDGIALGSAEVSAPYSKNWDTTQVGNGMHVIIARATDAAGNVGESAAVQVNVSNQTTDATPPQILSAAVVALASTNANLSWTTDEPAFAQVRYGTTNALGSNTPLGNVAVLSHGVGLIGLQPNTPYFYRVYAQDVAGNSVTSTLQTFVTPAFDPVLGTSVIANSIGEIVPGQAAAYQFTATVNSGVNQLQVFVDASNQATQLVVGLFANTRDDNPGDLLAQGVVANVTNNAWNKVAVPLAHVTQGSKYWLGVLSPQDTGGVLRVRQIQSIGAKSQASAQANLSQMPSVWSRGQAGNNSPLSAYAAFVDVPVPTATAMATATPTAQPAATKTSTATATPIPPTQTPTPTQTPMPAQTATPTPNVAQPVLLDTFNRANGGMGANWVGDVGQFSIQSNQLRSGADGSMYWRTGFGNDQYVSIKVGSLANKNEFGLHLKALNNYWASGVIEVNYIHGTGLTFYTYAGGNWDQRGALVPLALNTGDVLRVRARADGVVEVYRNDGLVVTRSVAAWSGFARAGQVGLWVKDANLLMDDFDGGTVDSAVATPTPALPPSATATVAVATSTFAPSKTPTRTPSPAATSATATPTRTPAPTQPATATPNATATRTTTPPPSATAVAGACPFPQAGVIDNFNRANGALGNGWVGDVNGFKVTTKQLSSSSSGAAVFRPTVFGASQEAYVKVSSVLPAGKAFALHLKATNNYWSNGVLEVNYTQGAGVQVYTFANNSWMQRGSPLAVSLVVNDVLGARAKSNGVVEIYKNSILLGSVQVTGWASFARAGQIGLWVEDGLRVFDDFGGGTVAGCN